MATMNEIDHPAHYQSKRGLETIDVMDAFTEGLTGYEAVCTSNVLKYMCRWKKKGGLSDLEKAEWYLAWLIKRERENVGRITTSSIRMDQIGAARIENLKQ